MDMALDPKQKVPAVFTAAVDGTGNIASMTAISIPEDSGLIFSFASSVLVFRREQLLRVSMPEPRMRMPKHA